MSHEMEGWRKIWGIRWRKRERKRRYNGEEKGYGLKGMDGWGWTRENSGYFICKYYFIFSKNKKIFEFWSFLFHHFQPIQKCGLKFTSL